MANTQAFRINDWWRSKAAMLMGMVYLFSLWFAIPFEKFLLLAALSLATISGFASTGYLLNDLFDRQKDLKAGKRNFLLGRGQLFILLSFTLALLLLFLPWLYLPFNSHSATLIVAEIFLFLIYSLPPLRLKERGAAGLLTDALYAHTVPVVLAAYTFSLAANVQMPLGPLAVLIVWQTLSGIRNILLHQHDDLIADAAAGSKNWVSKISNTSFLSAIKYLVLTETLSSIAFFALLTISQYNFLFCVLLICLWAVFALVKLQAKGMGYFMDTPWRHYPNNVYEKWLPPAFLLLLSLGNAAFALILLLHVLLFNLEFYVESYKYSYPVLRDTWVNRIRIPVRRKVSVVINYPIYYCFLLFGVDLRKENQSAIGYLKKKRAKK